MSIAVSILQCSENGRYAKVNNFPIVGKIVNINIHFKCTMVEIVEEVQMAQSNNAIVKPLFWNPKDGLVKENINAINTNFPMKTTNSSTQSIDKIINGLVIVNFY